jgi:prepilin-type N-terminal cleavage/methylation domain-containing protein
MTHGISFMNQHKLFFPKLVKQLGLQWDSRANNKGFTLVELIVVTAILGILASLSIAAYNSYVIKAKNSRAIADIRTLSNEVTAYSADNGGNNPVDLNIIKRGNLLDPWERPYVYTDIAGGGIALQGPFLSMLNKDFDIYSKGENNLSAIAFGVAGNNDDIVRSNDGAFVGLRP